MKNATDLLTGNLTFHLPARMQYKHDRYQSSKTGAMIPSIPFVYL